MNLETHLSSPRSAWTSGGGEMSDVVVSSRARLARNLDGYAFPEHLEMDPGEQVMQRVQGAVTGLGREWAFYRLQGLQPMDRQVLLEKHLISPQQAQSPERAALALREDEMLSVMVNEEDHLRVQAILPGLAVSEALRLALETDDRLEQNLDFAFTPDRGYLTACPTNVGTGLRLSVMLHLGGLVSTQRIQQLLQVLPKLGLAVRGLYGEGTEAVGNLFQISNQITLGQTEEEVAASIERAAMEVIEQERQARRVLAENALPEMQDRVHRAFGILRHARLLGAEETMQLLSDLRLGTEMGLLQVPLRLVNELLLLALPGFLAKTVGHELQPAEQRAERANLIRDRLQKEVG